MAPLGEWVGVWEHFIVWGSAGVHGSDSSSPKHSSKRERKHHGFHSTERIKLPSDTGANIWLGTKFRSSSSNQVLQTQYKIIKLKLEPRGQPSTTTWKPSQLKLCAFYSTLLAVWSAEEHILDQEEAFTSRKCSPASLFHAKNSISPGQQNCLTALKNLTLQEFKTSDISKGRTTLNIK